MVRNKLCCDASYAVGLSKQRNSYSPARLSFVLNVPLRSLRPSIVHSVPCERILPSYYWDLGIKKINVPVKTQKRSYIYQKLRRIMLAVPPFKKWEKLC